MAEKDLTIQGDSSCKIRIDPIAIRGEGSLEYTRLVIPLNLDVKPIKEGNEQKKFILLDIESSLFIQDSPQKIADAQSSSGYRHKISNPQELTSVIEFPLDAYRIKWIEEQRKGGDLKIRLELYFFIGIYDYVQSTPFQQAKKEKKWFLTEFTTSYVQLHDVKIPQSHWIKNILPSLYYLKYVLVELPEENKIIRNAWNYIEKAENAFMRWDIKGVFAYCREAGDFLENVIKEKFEKDDTSYRERWGRFYKGFNHWSSLDLHRVHSKIEAKKSDAEHLIFVTKSLIRYAEELLSEKELS